VVAEVLQEKTHQLEVVRSSDLLLPTRRYSDDEVAEILRQNGCDGYLAVRPVDRSVSRGGPGCVFHHADLAEVIVAALVAGSDDSLYQAVEVELIAVDSNRCVWKASTETESWGMEPYRSAMHSMAHKVANHLISAGLVR
jgi:hypothetical protein